MTKSLIDELVGDLSPAKPLKSQKLLFIILICFAIILLFVLAKYGLRSDFNIAWKNGTIAFKNGNLLIAIFAGIWAIDAISRPVEKKLNYSIIGALLAFALILFKFIELAQSSNLIYEINNINFGGASACLSVIIMGGIFIFALLWNFWLKHTASLNPIKLGAFAGATSGLVASFAYSFHCNMDGVFYFLICYWLPIIALSIFGAYCGKRLKW